MWLGIHGDLHGFLEFLPMETEACDLRGLYLWCIAPDPLSPAAFKVAPMDWTCCGCLNELGSWEFWGLLNPLGLLITVHVKLFLTKFCGVAGCVVLLVVRKRSCSQKGCFYELENNPDPEFSSRFCTAVRWNNNRLPFCSWQWPSQLPVARWSTFFTSPVSDFNALNDNTLCCSPLEWIPVTIRLPLDSLSDASCQWNVWLPRDISAMTNSCVVIPCTFMYPSGIRPYRGVHGIWYFGQPYPQLFPPVVFKTRTDVVHESYKGRTKLLGDLHQRNCTLLINNVGMEHSGRYYFRADLGGANMYTFPDYTELKVVGKLWIRVKHTWNYNEEISNKKSVQS